MPTAVEVTACDNELYILALPAAGLGSFEILHMTSGKGDTASYTVNLESILPSGSYTLVFAGINWGGPWKFDLSVGDSQYGNTGGTDTTVGVVWYDTDTVSI